MELDGKTVIVTGSGGGIGRALALAFAGKGARVVCCGRRKPGILKTVSLLEQSGGQGLAVKTDITQKDQVLNLVNTTIEHFGGIDLLYNNAGRFHALGGLWEVDAEDWWCDVTTNLLGLMFCCQAVLPHMMEKDSGIIINMSGGGSSGPLAGGSGYACSKAAVLRLTDTLAAELEREGSSVRVFALGPGLVRTEMTDYQAQSPAGQKWVPSTRDSIEEGRTREPDECAHSALRLIDLACAQLNGRVFAVNTDYDKIEANMDHIQKNDQMKLRLRPFGGP